MALAEDLGIDRATVEALHLDYFDQITKVAWADAALTTAEMADLVAVGNLLDVPTATIAHAFELPEPALASPVPLAELVEARTPATFTLTPGDLIVLTGEMSRSRSDWDAHLTSLGFTPWSAVTKKVKLLVAADPDSLSGKARKARDYGIPIVDEAGLERLLG